MFNFHDHFLVIPLTPTRYVLLVPDRGVSEFLAKHSPIELSTLRESPTVRGGLEQCSAGTMVAEFRKPTWTDRYQNCR